MEMRWENTSTLGRDPAVHSGTRVMFIYLLKYFLIIALASALPILVMLYFVYGDQNISRAVFPALRWGGILSVYLTYRLFASRNYWIFFRNFRLAYLPMLAVMLLLFEIIVIAIQSCLR
jgi:hypothetical protein